MFEIQHAGKYSHLFEQVEETNSVKIIKRVYGKAHSKSIVWDCEQLGAILMLGGFEKVWWYLEIQACSVRSPTCLLCPSKYLSPWANQLSKLSEEEVDKRIFQIVLGVSLLGVLVSAYQATLHQLRLNDFDNYLTWIFYASTLLTLSMVILLVKFEEGITLNKQTTSEGSFKTLMIVGQFIEIIGWLAFGIGLLGVIIGLVNLNKAWGQLMLMACGGAILFGILIAAQGQIIRCFVSIERNTERTSVALQSFFEQTQPTSSKTSE